MSKPDDMLSPANAPTELGKLSGVRRVNNLPLYIIGGIIFSFLLFMGFEAMNRAHPAAEATPEAKDKQGDTSLLAKSITGNRTGGFVPAADATPPIDASITVPIAYPDDMSKPPIPPRLKEASATPVDPDSARIDQVKMQLFENAVRSKTSVPLTNLHPATTAPVSHEETLQHLAIAQQRVTAAQKDDPNTVFKTRLAQLEGKDPKDSSQRNSFAQFDSKDKTDRWKLGNKVEAPKTPYTLRAGFVIPASLISGINSELPGQIIGQISQNVYDTATGKYLLLPQGSRLVGTYTSDVSYGQSRVMIAWQRIVFPDGKTIDIGAMPGADGVGYAGVSDQVDNHYLRIFGSAILMSGITAGATLSQGNNTNSIYGQQNASSALSEALGQQLGNVTSQMISKNLNTSPTLEIRPGFRFNVMCVKDLLLDKPYESFDYSGATP